MKKLLLIMILPFCLLFTTNAIAMGGSVETPGTLGVETPGTLGVETPGTLEDLENDDNISTEEIESSVVTGQGMADMGIAMGQGCFCAAEFTSFAQTAADLIKTPLAEQTRSLKKLKKSIKNHNTILEEQTAQLDKKINLLKEETLRNKEILFLLQQKNNLQ